MSHIGVSQVSTEGKIDYEKNCLKIIWKIQYTQACVPNVIQKIVCTLKFEKH